MAQSFVLQRLVMRKAVSVCGGDEPLSRVLNVPVVQMRRWIAGEDAAPLPLLQPHDALRKRCVPQVSPVA